MAMGLLSGLAKAGLAKKAVDEAKKPKNQRKLKSLFSKDKGRSGRRTG
jgi:hypothetical protein